MVKETSANVEDPIETATSAVDSDSAIGDPLVSVVRRKELVSRIVETSGVKPNLVKSVLDAVLKEMGDALSNGEIVNAQPFGKISVNRRKEVKNAEILICKIRRNRAPAEPSPEPEDLD